jgi:hypothetical protein
MFLVKAEGVTNQLLVADRLVEHDGTRPFLSRRGLSRSRLSKLSASPGSSRKEFRRVWMLRIGKDLFRRAEFEQFATFHYSYLIAELRGNAEVVGY